MIVIAILGMLVGLTVTNIGGMFGGGQKDIARLFVTSSMRQPLETYRAQMGDYPSTAEGLAALINPPANKSERWAGPYIINDRMPNDPWDQPYLYLYPGKRNKTGFDLWSKGPDKQDGTADDIGNWSSGAEAAK